MPNKRNNPKPAVTSSALEQLNDALSLTKQANTLLDAVRDGWSVPDAPEQPPYIEVLNQIKVEAARSTATADQLLGTMKR